MGKDRPLAEVVVLSEGKAITQRGNVRQRVLLDRTEISLGRGNYDCDILLVTEGDDSCPIDSLHCLIYYDAEEEAYFVVDNHSTYGTRVNEQELTNAQPMRLENGDDIELSKVRYGGVLLRFFILQEEKFPPLDETQPGPSANL